MGMQARSDAVQDLRGRAAFGHDALNDLLARSGPFEHDGFEQPVLIPEDFVHSSKRAAGPFDDFAQSGAFEPLFDEQCMRGFDHGPAATVQATEFVDFGHSFKTLEKSVARQGCNPYYTFAPAQSLTESRAS